MTMTQVTIPNDVADAIEHYRKRWFDNAKLTEFTLSKDWAGSYPTALRSIPFDTLMAALINGYEREQTAEQRALAATQRAHNTIRLEYLRCLSYCESEVSAVRIRNCGERDGIKSTLDTLGVKITEVNA
jgi:hypothetical protein